jgi:hypothetical protein
MQCRWANFFSCLYVSANCISRWAVALICIWRSAVCFRVPWRMVIQVVKIKTVLNFYVDIMSKWEILVNNSKQVTRCIPAPQDEQCGREDGLLWPPLSLRIQLWKRWTSQVFLIEFKSNDNPWPTIPLPMSLQISQHNEACSLQHCSLDKYIHNCLLVQLRITSWRHGGVEIQLPAFSADALHGQLHALATLPKGTTL